MIIVIVIRIATIIVTVTINSSVNANTNANSCSSNNNRHNIYGNNNDDMEDLYHDSKIYDYTNDNNYKYDDGIDINSDHRIYFMFFW